GRPGGGRVALDWLANGGAKQRAAAWRGVAPLQAEHDLRHPGLHRDAPGATPHLAQKLRRRRRMMDTPARRDRASERRWSLPRPPRDGHREQGRDRGGPRPQQGPVLLLLELALLRDPSSLLAATRAPAPRSALPRSPR